MGPGYFVIAILGCADGGSACTTVATLQTKYENEAQCQADAAPALEANTQFDFPTLLARCQAGTGGAVEAQRDRNSRSPIRRG